MSETELYFNGKNFTNLDSGSGSSGDKNLIPLLILALGLFFLLFGSDKEVLFVILLYLAYQIYNGSD